MSNPLKTRQFQKLKKKWYGKLVEAGFNDIETEDQFLKEYHSTRFKEKYSLETYKENERYWQLAGQLLNNYPFIDALEKKMWRLYTEGNDFRAIARITKSPMATVGRKIARIAKVIKL